MTNQEVWIWGETPGEVAQLLTAARLIQPAVGGAVCALVVGDEARAQGTAQTGVDTVYWAETAEPFVLEDTIDAMVALFQDKKPGVLICAATARGTMVAGSIAAKAGVTVASNVTKIALSKDKEVVQLSQAVYGKTATRTVSPIGDTWVIAVKADAFRAGEASNTEGEIVVLEPIALSGSIKLVAQKARTDSATKLSNAQRVVCMGGGLNSKEDYDLVEGLAGVLDAEIGCTRGVTELGLGFQQEHQVGISGFTVKPKIYLALGISGQVQHTIGITDSQIIISANKDVFAPIFEQSDYCFHGDAREFSRALTDALSVRA